MPWCRRNRQPDRRCASIGQRKGVRQGERSEFDGQQAASGRRCRRRSLVDDSDEWPTNTKNGVPMGMFNHGEVAGRWGGAEHGLEGGEGRRAVAAR